MRRDGKRDGGQGRKEGLLEGLDCQMFHGCEARKPLPAGQRRKRPSSFRGG